MAEAREPQNPTDSDEELRQGLLRRVAVAGVLVIVLLGGLALFDALNAPSGQGPIAKVAVEPPPAVEEKPVEAEAKPEEQRPEQVATTTTEAAKPEPAAVPERTETPLAKVSPASIRPAEPVLELKRPEPAAELSRIQVPSRLKHAPPSRPLTQAAERSRQFVLQMGVFNNVANAEELRAKLELAGVPAQIEARVQVGPFATRQEAEAAREKLRAMGMDAGFLTALRK